MTATYPLRTIAAHELDAWARMITTTYGQDWHEVGLRNAASSIEPGRTLAAYDNEEIVGGASIYGRFGYGIASHVAEIRGDKKAMALRPGTDLGDGMIRLLGRQEARPLLGKVYDTARRAAAGWVDRTERFWEAAWPTASAPATAARSCASPCTPSPGARSPGSVCRAMTVPSTSR
ncbi:hypothetical protein ABGB14_35530 [Nonomuraea sp. B10E15]|uniref:hypothetical protein n=1 Tax=Nonomuraea sp. B10E15 TaxID=3153560 RepID=UPI00325D7BFB